MLLGITPPSQTFPAVRVSAYGFDSFLVNVHACVHCMFQYKTPVSTLFGRVSLQILPWAQSVKPSNNNICCFHRESLFPQDHQVKPRVWRGKRVLNLSLGNSHLSSFWLCSLCVHVRKGFTPHPLLIKIAADLGKSMMMPLTSSPNKKREAWQYRYWAQQGRVSLIHK